MMGAMQQMQAQAQASQRGMPGNAPNPQGMMAQMMGGNRPGGPGGGPAMGGNPGMAGGPGMAGMMGRPGGQGSNNEEGDTTTPEGAVKAFMSALKAKDLDRLSEATALRAYIEARKPKDQEIFKRIQDGSLSESELAELADRLDGFKISGENPATSTKRLQIILRKTGQNNSWYTRMITVRKEKKGWGVCDISGVGEFKSPRMYMPGRGNNQTTGKGGGR